MSARRRTIAAIVVVTMVGAMGSGCQYLEMVQRRRAMRREFASEPRVALLRVLAPEDAFHVTGRLAEAEGHVEPLLVVAITHRHAADEIVTWKLVARDLELYKLLLPEGHYELVVLEDLDHNEWFESNEVVGRTDPTAPAQVGGSAATDGFLIDGPAIRIDPHQPGATGAPIRVAVTRTGNVVPSLADDFFALRWGQVGLYHPADLLVHTQGYFFGLEAPDPEKTQVIFVHGAGGAPVEFTSLVDGLDRTRYQPWFFFYPSGLPLEQSATALSHALEIAASDLGLRHLAIVAHSMGGLVAHAALALVCRDGVPDWMELFVSIATPYGGHEAAGRGVQRAPEVVPSWRDVAPDSRFLNTIQATPLPAKLPLYLVFAYDNRGRMLNGPSGDGTVTLRSQLAVPVQRRARRVLGVDATHTGVLTDPLTREIVVELLAEHAAPRNEGVNPFTFGDFMSFGGDERR